MWGAEKQNYLRSHKWPEILNDAQDGSLFCVVTVRGAYRKI